MAEKIRIEIGIDGSPGVNLSVDPADADALEQALAGAAGGTVTLKTDDGTLTVAVAKVTYVRRHSRESRVGFGTL